MIVQRFKVIRLEAISDGVFAIAMTLLVLDLKLQSVDHDIDADLFASALKNQFPQFVSWIISLAILCRLWMTQHALLKDLPEESSLFTWLNFGFLGGVSFIPFPTSLISEHGNQPLSVVLFSLAVVFCGLMLGLMSIVRGQPGGEAIGWKHLHPAAKRILIGMPLVGLLASLLAFWKPSVGSTIWIVMPFLGMSIVRNRRLHKAQEANGDR